MSGLASPRSPTGSGDFEYDEENDADFEDSRDDDRESDEESDLGSEGETHGKEEYTGIKEQMYQDKLAQLKKQLQQLRDNSHPEYNKKMKKIDATYKERLRLNDLWRDVEIECVERDYQAERKLACRDFEEKKKELKENLLIELEDKKKIIEQERYTLELTGDSMEYKPVSTRKLRRRGNEPAPIVEKRRKPVATTLQLLLDEREMDEDLKLINKSKLMSMKKSTVPVAQPEPVGNEPKIENGKLYFDRKCFTNLSHIIVPTSSYPSSPGQKQIEKRATTACKRGEGVWCCQYCHNTEPPDPHITFELRSTERFHKGQAVMVECKDGTRFNAILTVAGVDMIMVRKVPDNIRLKITLAQLAHGKYLVRRRSSS